MSEDVTTTPEGETATPETEVSSVTPEPAKVVNVPDDLKWVLDPNEAVPGVQKLKEKSETRLQEIERLKQANAELQQKLEADNQRKLAEAGQYKELYESLSGSQKTLRIDNAILTQLMPFNFISAEQVLKLIDRARLVVSDDGVVSGVKEALQVLADENPNLIQQTKQPTTPAQKPTNPATETKSRLTREELMNKSPDWVAAHMDEVNAALKEMNNGS